jgi:hypothetical protein
MLDLVLLTRPFNYTFYGTLPSLATAPSLGRSASVEIGRGSLDNICQSLPGSDARHIRICVQDRQLGSP